MLVSKVFHNKQEQLAAIQAQIQALLAGGAVARSREEATEMAKLQIFDNMSSKVSGFISAYKLYIRMKLRKESVEG